MTAFMSIIMYIFLFPPLLDNPFGFVLNGQYSLQSLVPTSTAGNVYCQGRNFLGATE
jgi:hypothetical protein